MLILARQSKLGKLSDSVPRRKLLGGHILSVGSKLIPGFRKEAVQAVKQKEGRVSHGKRQNYVRIGRKRLEG